MDNTELEQHCNSLRLDLKTWEKKFAAAHDGRKAGRDDIKADATISHKYKEYNKLRDVLTGKVAPGTPTRKVDRHRVTRNIDRTPKAPKALATTPMKRKREDSGTEEAPESPAQVVSPEGPAFIGPTPQRDGKALGLFDHLPFAGFAETPTKPRNALTDVDPNSPQTPRRGKTESEASSAPRARGTKTPQSVGKRSLLASFMAVTPSQRKSRVQGTPSKDLATPAFLRRYNPMEKIDEDEENAPRVKPWMRRKFGRSLSERIRTMRQQEEDQLDEEADIMRELEEADSMPAPKKIKMAEVQVEDSQAAMPLGPDRGLETEDDEEGEEENELGPDGKPRRVWKKKGLKRQTRRVNMKPNFSKPKPQPEFQHNDSDDDTKVAETQIDPFDIPSDLDLSDDDGSDYASDASHSTKKRNVQQPKPKAAQPKDSIPSKEGPVKTAARKIKPWAHANYQRLKIKSKGGNGGKGRFGRKR